MARLPDWEPRLAAYLESVRDREFVWGEHDCALHAANAVLAITGEDFAAPFRGKYSTGAGSVRALKRYGAGTLEATFDAALPEIGNSFAQRGDIVLRDGMVGVCLGADAAFVGEADGVPGLVRFPRREWSRAWAVR
jgi:hypothetical protein